MSLIYNTVTTSTSAPGFVNNIDIIQRLLESDGFLDEPEKTSCDQLDSVTPKHIHYSGDKTIVEFFDGEKVIVSKESGTSDNHYLAFCAALAKKIFGTTSKVIEAFNAADDVHQYELKQKAKQVAAEEKQRKHRDMVEKERRLRDVRIAQLADELYLKKKAEELANQRIENEMTDPNF